MNDNGLPRPSEGALPVGIRRFVGQNIESRLLGASLTHEQLADTLRARGLLPWDRSTVSRVISGSRALKLDEAVVLCNVLGVPIAALLAGDDQVEVAPGCLVPARQVREMVLYGRSIDGPALADGPLGSALSAQLGLAGDELDDACLAVFGLPWSDELERRVRASHELFTGGSDAPVNQRRHAGWVGAHSRRMRRELVEAGYGQASE